MNKKFLITIVIIIILIGAGVWGYFTWQNKYGETPPNKYLNKYGETPQIIGGDRDTGGCLIGAGYMFNENVGACIRSFEMTSDIMQAAKLAVDHVGRSYGLTVVSFNSYEEPGAYDIFVQLNLDDAYRETIYIRNGEVVESPDL